ncbi:hypothetical protein ABPG75_001265 [Micractinium tetrahymenae]
MIYSGPGSSHIMELDGGYLVARRRHCRAQQAAVARKPLSPLQAPAQPAPPPPQRQQGPSLLSTGSAATAPASWTAAHEQRYQRSLTFVRLIVHMWRTLPHQPAGGEARFVAALAAVALTARKLHSLRTRASSHS